MNLPPPFSEVTPTPPLPDDKRYFQDACVDTMDLQLSSEESELESEGEEDRQKAKGELYTGESTSQPLPKRRKLKTVRSRDQEIKLAAVDFLVKEKSILPSVDTAFELPKKAVRANNLLSASIQEAVERKTTPAVSYNVFDERDKGFGRIEPPPKKVEVLPGTIKDGEKEKIVEEEVEEEVEDED